MSRRSELMTWNFGSNSASPHIYSKQGNRDRMILLTSTSYRYSPPRSLIEGRGGPNSRKTKHEQGKECTLQKEKKGERIRRGLVYLYVFMELFVGVKIYGVGTIRMRDEGVSGTEETVREKPSTRTGKSKSKKIIWKQTKRKRAKGKIYIDTSTYQSDSVHNLITTSIQLVISSFLILILLPSFR